jgi:TolB-like protein/class 3 adenylate cyclase/Tfp pilus assembly protein PilF
MSTEIKKEIKLEIGHVLFMDIVGYSKLLINEQRAARETLNQIVRQTEQFREADAVGSLIKSPTGDGMALVFRGSPEEPVECALEISRALKAHPNLPLRMGVHSGPVSGVVDVNDTISVAGAGINMCQRVMDCGDAGHILVSKHVAEDLEQYAHWKPYLHDLGECEVKHGVRVYLVNLYTDELGNRTLPEKLKRFRGLRKVITPRPTTTLRGKWPTVAAAVLVVALFATGIVISRSRWQPKPEEAVTPSVLEKSIAVLPFANLSRDPDNAYFADAIQDEILTRLAKIGDLKVISRTSTLRYRTVAADVREIAKQLGVAHILEGSVQKSGDIVRVNVQLIKAGNDAHLWADTFDRKLLDIFSVESEVAKAIADQLRAKLTGQEEQVIAAKPTDNVDAYDAYLRGLAYTLKTQSTTDNSLGAQKYLREAVRLDPKFALGWARLSYVDALGYWTQGLQPTVALREEARQAAETARTLQPKLGETLLAEGYYHYYCLTDYNTAVHYFEQARQLLPNSSLIPESLAYVARRRGQWEQSEGNFNDAERLNPRDVDLLTQHALFYIAVRRFPEALRKLDQVLNITPDDPDTIMLKAGIAQAEGDLPQASKLLASLPPAAASTNALETQAYQAILERNPAQIITRLREKLAKPDPASGFYNGELRFWLGWAQEIAGDHSAAQESWRQARSELESFLKEQPENFIILGDLALTNIGVGDRAAALALAERSLAANPTEKDALLGPFSIEILARVVARTGDSERAIATLQKLLSIPYTGPLAANVPLTPALLRFDPMFDPLRNDQRFQKLASAPVAKDAK